MVQFNLWVARVVGRIQELREEDGQAMVEYALILALVSVAAIATLTLLGGQVDRIFGVIKDALLAV